MAIYKFTCPHCKDAPPRGQWRRSWKWKTEKGYLNHNCYANETPTVHRRPVRDNGKIPDWLGSGEELFCPSCHEGFRYSGPQAASLHFPCPRCGDEIQFARIGDWETQESERVCSLCGSPMIERKGKYGVFWGCSAYSRSNPCKGKAVMVPGVGFDDVLVMEVFDDGAGLVYEDAVKVARAERWRDRELRQDGRK